MVLFRSPLGSSLLLPPAFCGLFLFARDFAMGELESFVASCSFETNGSLGFGVLSPLRCERGCAERRRFIGRQREAASRAARDDALVFGREVLGCTHACVDEVELDATLAGAVRLAGFCT